MDVASLIVKIGADVSSLEAGLSRAQQMTEAAAARLARGAQEAGQAEVQAANEAAAAQKQVAAALDNLRAKYAEMRGDVRTSMELKFPQASPADLDSLTQAKTAIRQLGEEMATAKPTVEGFVASFAFQQIGASLEGFGEKVIGRIREFVTAGGDLQQQLLDIKGNTLLTDKQFEQVSETIKKVGASTPVPLEELSGAMLRISNEGFQGADAMKVFDAATKAAVTTGAKASDVANILASTLVTLGLPASQAAKVMNELHVAAALGNETLQEFSLHSGKAHSTAHQFGVTLTDVDAALSTLTRHGFDAAKSETGVVGMMVKIANPTKQVLGLVEQITQKTGIDLVNSFSAAGLRAKGLMGVLEDIHKAAEKLNVNPSDLASKLIAAQRGGLQAGELETPSTFRDLHLEKQQLDKTMSGAYAPIEANYEERLKSFNAQLQILENEFKLIGSDLLTAFGPALKSFTGWVHDLAEGFRALSPRAKEFIGFGAAAAGGVALVTGKVIQLVAQLALLRGALGAGGAAGLLGKGAGAAAGAAGGAGAGFELPAVAAAGGGGLLARLGSLFTGGALSGLTPKVDVTGDIIRNLGLDKRFPGLFGDYGKSSDIRAAKEVSAPSAGGGASPTAGLSPPAAKGAAEEFRNVRDALAPVPKDIQKFQAATETLDAKLIDLRASLKGNETSLAALKLRYPDVSEAALKLFRAHELEAQGMEKTLKLRAAHSAALAKEKEHYKEAVDAALAKLADTKGGGDEESSAQKIAKQFPHASAAQRDYLQNIGEETKKQKEVADARKKAENELKTLTNEVEASRGKLVQQQAIAAAGGRVWDVHALALEKTHRAYEGLGPPMRQAIDDLAALGRQTQAAELLAKSTQEIEKAKAGLQALRTGDAAGLLRAEHLGVDDATIGKLSAYQQQLLGIKNATEAIKAKTSPIIDPATKNALEALKRYAGTGNLEAQQAQGEANQLNQIARTLNQYQAGSGGGADAAQRLNFLKQGAFPPEMLETLKKAVGDVDQFFGGIKNESQQAADAIAVANKSNQEAALAYLTATKDWGTGLVRNLASMDAMIHDIGQAASAALRSSGGGVSGARAMGGSVSGGASYLVGERGPEIFTPGASGNITPNSALGGGDTHVHVNMVVHAADAASFHRSQGQMMQNLGRAVERHMSRNG